MGTSKIVPLEDLSGINGILLHGSFDCLHVGHLRYFAWGKKLHPCQKLIVTLTADEFFPKYKGENRPAFPQDVRAECISYIDLVDYVAIVNEPTGVLAINTIKPYVYGKGAEAQGLIPEETAAVEFWNGRVEFMTKECDAGQIYSSGRILSGEYLRSRNKKIEEEKPLSEYMRLNEAIDAMTKDEIHKMSDQQLAKLNKLINQQTAILRNVFIDNMVIKK